MFSQKYTESHEIFFNKEKILLQDYLLPTCSDSVIYLFNTVGLVQKPSKVYNAVRLKNAKGDGWRCRRVTVKLGMILRTHQR